MTKPARSEHQVGGPKICRNPPPDLAPLARVGVNLAAVGPRPLGRLAPAAGPAGMPSEPLEVLIWQPGPCREQLVAAFA